MTSRPYVSPTHPDEPSLEARPTSPLTPGITKVLPSGFAALAEADLLSVEVLGVLERVVHLWNRITKGLSLSSSSFSSDSGKGKGKAAELTPNFWSACPSLAVSIPPDEEPTIDNLLALGLWLYVALEFSNRSIAESMLLWISMSRSARQDLSTRLMRCAVSRHSDEEDCLMWLFEIAIASWTGPDGALLPQGLALLELRYLRFGYRPCAFHKFFHFSKKWPGLSPQQDVAGRVRRRNILRAPESWTRLKFS